VLRNSDYFALSPNDKGQQLQPLRYHSAASLRFKTPDDLGFAAASSKSSGLFAGCFIIPSIFSTGFFASKFLNGVLPAKTGPCGFAVKKSPHPSLRSE
jgi:hypothetical protein